MTKIDFSKPLQTVTGVPVVLANRPVPPGWHSIKILGAVKAHDGHTYGSGECFHYKASGKHAYDCMPDLQNVPEAPPAPEPKKVAPRLTPLAKRVLKYLQKKGSASATEAFLDLDQLASGSFTRRLTELRQAGYPITDETRQHPITGRQYKRYFYALHS